MSKKLQKLSFFKSPLIIAAVICFVIALLIPLFAPKEQAIEVKGVTQGSTPTATETPVPTEEFRWVASPTTIVPTATPVPPQATSTTVPTSVPQQSQQVETFTVLLSVNGASVGEVTMQKDQNQCDVLTRAKDQGKISQLLMKYDNSLGTHGVYQINGIGKENIVWWVYKVNGQSPTQGCSYIKANNGDSVEWEYKG